MAFTTIVLFQLFNALNARSGTRSIFTGLFSNRWLWATIAASLLLQSIVLDTPLLQHAFGVVALSIGQWAQCAVIGSSVVWVVELEKLVRGFIQSRKKAGRTSGTF